MELVDSKKYKLVEMEKLVPADWNYKTEDEEIGEKLANNLKRNGQVENILVRELPTGALEVVNGNHRYHAMKTLGAKKIMAYNLGAISTNEAIRIAIETNETKFATDNVKLGQLMHDLKEDFSLEELEATMPYSAKHMELMAELPSFNWDSFGSSSGEKKEGDDTEEWETFKVRLPKDVCELLNQAIEKVRVNLRRATKRPVDDDIRPIEVLALLIREMSDDEIIASLS